jgi:hypothetical protein
MFVAYLHTVNRLHTRGTTHDVDLIVGKCLGGNIPYFPHIVGFNLDVHAELFDAQAGDRTAVAIARYFTFLCIVVYKLLMAKL